MIARDGVRCLRQWVLTIEHDVRAGDGELGDGDGVETVAEVDESGQHRISLGVASHQEIVVVGVVMDDAAFETGQARNDPFSKPDEVALHQIAPGRLGDVLGVVTELMRALDVPDEIPVDSRVVETLEGEIEACEGSADLLEEPRRSLAKTHEWGAVEKGQNPDPAAAFPSSIDRNQAATVASGKDLLHEVCDRRCFEEF